MHIDFGILHYELSTTQLIPFSFLHVETFRTHSCSWVYVYNKLYECKKKKTSDIEREQ